MFSSFIACIQRHWILCFVVALLGGTAAFAMSAILTPIYRVELTLAPASEIAGQDVSALGGLGGLVAAAGFGANPAQVKNEAMAILTSRTFIADFIRDNNLIPALFPDAFSSDGTLLASEETEPPTLNQAVTRLLDGMMRVSDDLRTGLVTVRMEHEDPEIALAWTRELVARVNETMRRRDIAEATESIEYLTRELSQTSQVSTRDAIGRVLQEQLQKSAIANARREYVFRVLEPGMVPDRPVRPRRLRMTFAGFFLAGALSVFVFCAREGVFSPRLNRSDFED